METFDFEVEMTKATSRFEVGAPIEAVSKDLFIACINRTTIETFNSHGLEIAVGCASVYSNFVASSFTELGYPGPKSFQRDGEAFLMVRTIYFHEQGIHCNQRREVALELRKRIAFGDHDLDLVSAGLAECRAEAARRLNRSSSTIERQELKFRKALLNMVTFDHQTGFFGRSPFYESALFLSLDQVPLQNWGG